MKIRVGLRTEVIVNITFLMGAALFFGGFLLLKLTEGELVNQRVAGATASMHILARAFGEIEPGDGNLQAAVDQLIPSLAVVAPVEGWGLVDQGLSLRASSPEFPLQVSEIGRVRNRIDPSVRLSYDSTWFPGLRSGESSVLITAPILQHNQFLGGLQARFSLADVRIQVINLWRLVFLYAFLYGLVLVCTGVYLLSRNVVQPIRRLMAMTRQVAGGDLGQTLSVDGPREIAELSGSFNSMLAALQVSGRQREEMIVSLQRANLDLVRTQQELVRSEKMASVGHLAAGMAHEIGNPLGAVVGYLEMLRGDLVDPGQRELARRSLDEVARIDRLVRDLLDYASPSSGMAERIDPGVVLSDARQLLEHQGAMEGVRLIDDLPSTLPVTLISRHKLLQVFVNLLLNARDASLEGGLIRLSGGETKERVWLSVADEGAGMSSEVAAHIFDPFYTTKAPGKGRGLGLSVCHRVIDEAGGTIEVESAPGEGSCFTVYLSRAESIDDER